VEKNAWAGKVIGKEKKRKGVRYQGSFYFLQVSGVILLFRLTVYALSGIIIDYAHKRASQHR